MGIVKGYTGLVHPTNLAVNGAFLINQRGLRIDTWGRVAAGDYMADMFVIGAETNVDYLEGVQGSAGSLGFRGTGKANQQIILAHREARSLGVVAPTTIRTAFTETCKIGVAATSVPLYCDVVPQRRDSDYSNDYSFSKVIRPSEHARVGRIISTLSHGIDYGAYAVIRLQQDGYFECGMVQWQRLCGAYVNPPESVPVHYAEDLARCQRYYQAGLTIGKYPMISTGANNEIDVWMPFQTKMAGTPSVTLAQNAVNLHQLASAGSGLTTADAANWTFTGVSPYAHGFRMYGSRSSVAANRDIAYVELAWTATV